MFTKKTTYLLSIILCSLLSNTTQSSHTRPNLAAISLHRESFQRIPSDAFSTSTYSSSQQAPSRTNGGLVKVRPLRLLAKTQQRQEQERRMRRAFVKKQLGNDSSMNRYLDSHVSDDDITDLFLRLKLQPKLGG